MESSERSSENIFSNGDVYFGAFNKDMLPNGNGKYTWSNGTVYEGDWEDGKMTGKGKLTWPSGSRYEGDFSDGYLHGFGTFSGLDGSVYRGAWRLNTRHGIGEKRYQNLDFYEGSWREGVYEGSGRYAWSNGNTYIGNWKAGKMCGRGVMKWSNGHLFDGFWLNGLRHGSGFYRFEDGGYYFGTWTKGLKDGRGTFYTAGSKQLSLKKWCSFHLHKDKLEGSISHSSSMNSEECRVMKSNVKRSLSEKISLNGFLRGSGCISHKSVSLEEDWSLSDSMREVASCDTSCMLSHTSDDGQSEVQDNGSVVYEQEYMQGVMVKERILNNSNISSNGKQRCKAKEAKKKSCGQIFLGHKSYCLMLNLQLGIRYTVGKITPVPMREVRSSDFGERARIRMYFPRKGSQFTPPHYSLDFYWMDYCPMVFRNLREMFKLDAADYMMSICGDDGLRELSSPGKSGSIFYVSHDDRFFIKTLRRSELKVRPDTYGAFPLKDEKLLAVSRSLSYFFTEIVYPTKPESDWEILVLIGVLLKMLPSYYDHVKEHDNTLITKFFGVHRITWTSGRKVHFVVMGNMFCTELRIHRRYDLKGSYQGRITNKNEIAEDTTLKDLDLSYEFRMDKLLRESLFKQISLDCMFLESQQIIDYSLLLGLHFRAPEHLKALPDPTDSSPKPESVSTTDGDLLIPPKGLLLVTHEPNFVSTTPGPHVRGNTLRAYSVGEKEVDLLLPGTGRLRVQLGVNMPAQASHKLPQDDMDAAEVELFEVYDVILYLGIIDILQKYNLKKKLEHKYKSLRYDPLSISVIAPKLYSKRFINFLERVFPAEP